MGDNIDISPVQTAHKSKVKKPGSWMRLDNKYLVIQGDPYEITNSKGEKIMLKKPNGKEKERLEKMGVKLD